MNGRTAELAATFRQVLAEHENGGLGGLDLAESLAAAASETPTVDELLGTKAGLLLAHTAFEGGASSMLRSVNETQPGQPWGKPENPYWKTLGPLLTKAKEQRGGASSE